jgi:xylulokinase
MEGITFMAVLGIDIGTSSCKTVLVDLTGVVLAQATSSYPLSTPHPFWSEQAPEDWWNALVLSVREILKQYPNIEIQGIGLSGQMHGLVLTDKNNAVLRPAILWNDGRSQKECELLYQHSSILLKETGNLPLAGYPAPKILWVQGNEPAIWKKVHKIALPKDYLRFRLTGTWVTDMSDGSGTLLMNVEKRKWSDAALELCQMDANRVPELVEGTKISGYLTKEAAQTLGLKSGIPVVGSAGDQSAAAIGMGCNNPGQTMISLGTSGVVFTITQGYQKNTEKAINSFCHALPNTWFHMGVTLSAAGSLQWYRDTCAINMNFNVLCESAQNVSIGADDLFFLPYLTGERTPHCNPFLRAAFIGLSRRHSQAHLTRAVLEGVGFGIYEAILLMRAGGIDIREATMAGSGAQSAVWLQLLADIFNIPLIQTESSDVGPALGAARLAILGCIGGKIEEICPQPKSIKHFLPNFSAVLQYQPIMQRFQALSPLLKGHFSPTIANRTVLTE